MRALVVHPGPSFSVSDVHNGWVRGLTANGVNVLTADLDNAIWLYGNAQVEQPDGTFIPALSAEDACFVASKHVQAFAYVWLPDVVFIVSGFFMDQFTAELLRARGSKVVWVCTESPYEDETQLRRAQWASDLVILNDPTNIDRYRDAGLNALYVPHSYDPGLHRPGPVHPDYESDVCIVGTGYPSRVRFLEQMDWSGIDLALLGMWKTLDGHPLAQRVRGIDPDAPEDDPDRYEVCVDNTETVRYYQSTHASVNLYRKEAERDDLADGWAMGPREVELAACGTFFVTEPRGENCEALPMVPKVSDPGEASEVLRWYLAHDDARAEVSRAARQAIDGWTFENRTAEVLRSLDR